MWKFTLPSRYWGWDSGCSVAEIQRLKLAVNPDPIQPMTYNGCKCGEGVSPFVLGSIW